MRTRSSASRWQSSTTPRDELEILERAVRRRDPVRPTYIKIENYMCSTRRTVGVLEMAEGIMRFATGERFEWWVSALDFSRAESEAIRKEIVRRTKNVIEALSGTRAG